MNYVENGGGCTCVENLCTFLNFTVNLKLLKKFKVFKKISGEKSNKKLIGDNEVQYKIQ